MVTPNPCAACGAPVSSEEVAQGLAVKVSGRLLCPLCIDHLPGDAKVAVNQMRALRGMAVTTYRYYSGRHPRLPMYTFTTAALVLSHRRRLVNGEAFDAPPLPPPGSRPRLPTASEAARGDRTGWMAVAGISILVVTGVVWLLIPSAPTPPPTPPVPAVRPAQADPAPAADTPQRPAATGAAARLRSLEERLELHPDQARSIADEAELLALDLPAGDRFLRNRAADLAGRATALAESQRPRPQLAPAPPDGTAAPAVPAVQPQPPPAPVLAPSPPPAVVAPVPPAPTPAPAVTPRPEPAHAAATPAPAPPAKPAKAARSDGPSQADVEVAWPPGAKPLIDADGLPARRDVPWPWPTGDPIHAGAAQPRNKKRLAIELRLAGVSAVGGATIVVHPGKAERQSLQATWTDGEHSSEPIIIPLDGLRWQALAIPAAGSEDVAADSMRLRLEDAKDISDERPFLVAGASVRWDAAPERSDQPMRIPLLMPSGTNTPSGPLNWRNGKLQPLIARVKDPRFAFARAKVLLPLSSPGGGKFGPVLRAGLAALQRVDKAANGSLADLPWEDPAFANPQTAWPESGMDDLDRHPAVALGWRGTDPGNGVDPMQVLAKLLTSPAKPKRPICMPLLVIGDVDRAGEDQRAVIDRRWSDIAERAAASGIPVIDLRPAQAERGTDEVQRMAARMLVDALRQLDWLLSLK